MIKEQLQLFDLAPYHCPEFAKLEAPKTLPVDGQVDTCLIGAAKEKFEKFLAATPEDPFKSNALLYLEFAYQMAVMQERLAHSIYWRRATYAVRLDCAQQLEGVRSQIQSNLQKFLVWWFAYRDRCEKKGIDLWSYFDIKHTDPAWVKEARHWEIVDLRFSVRNLAEIEQSLDRKLVKIL